VTDHLGLLGPSSAWIADMISVSTWAVMVSASKSSPESAASFSVWMRAATW